MLPAHKTNDGNMMMKGHRKRAKGREAIYYSMEDREAIYYSVGAHRAHLSVPRNNKWRSLPSLCLSLF